MSTSHTVPGTQVEGTLTFQGQEFPFYLERKALDLGSAGNVQFYYMPPSKLRNQDPLLDVSNFRSCIGLWYAAMRSRGIAEEWDQQCLYVTATCYALINRAKGPQAVCRDAFLFSDAFNIRDITLDDAVRDRITTAIKSQDRSMIKHEFDLALDVPPLSHGDQLGIQQAIQNWEHCGVEALRKEGEEGVISWLEEVDHWIHKYRKRSSSRVRRFINHFSYQCKVSFYLCFANFWSSLIPWLQEHHGLDDLSAKFLSFWHNQNQPIGIPHGQTRSGIVYPTFGRARTISDENGQNGERPISWETERLGPDHMPDIFSGQVLSLHPLSWILLRDEALRETVGRCIASPKMDTLQSEGADNFPEYWRLVDSVLTSAYLYQRAHDEYENRRRGPQEVSGSTIDVGQNDSSSQSPNKFMKRFIASRALVCRCNCLLQFDELIPLRPANNEDEVFQDDECNVNLICEGCGSSQEQVFTSVEIGEFISSEDTL